MKTAQTSTNKSKKTVKKKKKLVGSENYRRTNKKLESGSGAS